MSEEINSKNKLPDIEKALKSAKNLIFEATKDAFINMIKLAKQRREYKCWSNDNGLERYIRLNRDSFKVVSLHKDNACGALRGKDGKPIGNSKNINAAHEILDSDELTFHKAGNEKPEHRVQAYIINEYFSKNCDTETLPHLLSSKDDVFDEMWFCDEEFSIEDIRADMIALGKKGDDYFPIFIELKAKVDTKDLITLHGQLHNIYSVLFRYKDLFTEYLSAVTKVSKDEIDFFKSRKIAILPKRDTKQSATTECIKNMISDNILVIEYEQNKDNKYSFSLEKP